MDSAGNFFVADSGNSTIRTITPDGLVTNFAGMTGVPGSDDGTGSDTRFSLPTDIDVDTEDNLYVVDQDDDTVRKITPDGTTRTLAGKLEDSDWVDGPGEDARFSLRWGVAFDAAGNVYVADSNNDDIRRISPGE